MRKVRVSVWMMAVTAAAASVILALPSVRMSSLETETPAKVSLLTVENGEICGTTALRGALRYEQEYAAIAPVTGIVACLTLKDCDPQLTRVPFWALLCDPGCLTTPL